MLEEFKDTILVPFKPEENFYERIITTDHLNYVKSNDTFDFEEINHIIDIDDIQEYLEYEIIGKPIIERTQDCNGGYLSSYYNIQICLDLSFEKRLTTIQLCCCTNMCEKKHYELSVKNLNYIKYDDLSIGFRFDAYKGYNLNLSL
jgi:hypothetical protein